MGRGFFRNLRRTTYIRKYVREQNRKGRSYYKKRLLLSILERWKLACRGRKLSKVKNMIAFKHREQNLLKAIFEKWISFTFTKLKSIEENKSAICFYMINVFDIYYIYIYIFIYLYIIYS